MGEADRGMMGGNPLLLLPAEGEEARTTSGCLGVLLLLLANKLPPLLSSVPLGLAGWGVFDRVGVSNDEFRFGSSWPFTGAPFSSRLYRSTTRRGAFSGSIYDSELLDGSCDGWGLPSGVRAPLGDRRWCCWRCSPLTMAVGSKLRLLSWLLLLSLGLRRRSMSAEKDDGLWPRWGRDLGDSDG